MNQEIKLKLEQALADKLTNYIKQRHDQSRCVGYSDGVLAGAQTILENPGEWGMVKSSTFESLRHDYNTLSKAIDGVVSNRIEEWKANNDVLKDVSALQSQLTKYREVLERIVNTSTVDAIAYPLQTVSEFYNIAKEALKQHDNETDNTGN